MASITGAYAAVIFAAVIHEDDGQCALSPLMFSDQPPADTGSGDIPTTLCYADQQAGGQLAIYIKTSLMGPAELFRSRSPTESGNSTPNMPWSRTEANIQWTPRRANYQANRPVVRMPTIQRETKK